jgi:hypothetical protein
LKSKTSQSLAPQQGGAPSVSSAQPPVDHTRRPGVEPIEKQREDARQAYTIFMLLIFAGQLLIGGIAVFTGSWASAEEYLKLTVPATIGVLGSAIGFYFGSQR